MSWVTGPTPLTDSRHFNVTVGTHVVLLINGRPRERVYTAGRNGGIINLFGDRHVPLTGNLATLEFRSAVDVAKLVSADVRLADGATVTVTADLEVKPAWEANDRLLLEWVNRYGANSATIESAARTALDGDFAAVAISSLGPLTHHVVHATADKRSLLKSPGRPTGLLGIDKILNVRCTQDPHALAAHNTRRETIVNAAQAEADRFRFELTRELDALRADHANRLDSIRAAGQLGLDRARARNQALINQAVAAYYSLTPAEVAYPQLLADRQRAMVETMRDVLTEHADMLPLLAEYSGSGPAGFVQHMFSAAATPPTPGRPSSTASSTAGQARTAATATRALPGAVSPAGDPKRWASTPEVATKLAAVGITDRVVGSAVCDGPQGRQRIALTASGSDRVVGGVGVSGSTNAIVVRERATVFETANNVLAAVAQWCGYTLGYKPVNDSHAGDASRGLLLLDIDKVSPRGGGTAHRDAPLALAAWVSAINTLMADGSPRVAVSVLGQR